MKAIRRKAPSGQSLVEFALIIPLFILIVMFIFDIGRAVYYYSVMYNAVREGARSAAVMAPAVYAAQGDTLKYLVVNKAYGMDLDPDNVVFAPSGGELRVEATYDFSPITPIVGLFLPGGEIAIYAETNMRFEYEAP